MADNDGVPVPEDLKQKGKVRYKRTDKAPVPKDLPLRYEATFVPLRDGDYEIVLGEPLYEPSGGKGKNKSGRGALKMGLVGGNRRYYSKKTGDWINYDELETLENELLEVVMNKRDDHDDDPGNNGPGDRAHNYLNDDDRGFLYWARPALLQEVAERGRTGDRGGYKFNGSDRIWPIGSEVRTPHIDEDDEGRKFYIGSHGGQTTKVRVVAHPRTGVYWCRVWSSSDPEADDVLLNGDDDVHSDHEAADGNVDRRLRQLADKVKHHDRLLQQLKRHEALAGSADGSNKPVNPHVVKRSVAVQATEKKSAKSTQTVVEPRPKEKEKELEVVWQELSDNEHEEECSFDCGCEDACCQTCSAAAVVPDEEEVVREVSVGDTTMTVRYSASAPPDVDKLCNFLVTQFGYDRATLMEVMTGDNKCELVTTLLDALDAGLRSDAVSNRRIIVNPPTTAELHGAANEDYHARLRTDLINAYDYNMVPHITIQKMVVESMGLKRYLDLFDGSEKYREEVLTDAAIVLSQKTAERHAARVKKGKDREEDVGKTPAPATVTAKKAKGKEAAHSECPSIKTFPTGFCYSKSKAKLCHFIHVAGGCLTTAHQVKDIGFLGTDPQTAMPFDPMKQAVRQVGKDLVWINLDVLSVPSVKTNCFGVYSNSYPTVGVMDAVNNTMVKGQIDRVTEGTDGLVLMHKLSTEAGCCGAPSSTDVV